MCLKKVLRNMMTKDRWRRGGGGTLGGGDVGALGALGDESCCLGDGVLESSSVKSTNNCIGEMMLIFGLLEALEMEALVDAMVVDRE
nr:hypothetical protein [Tanacetum cinerariifolium]